ncbi:MAG: hypothetical protein R3D67_17185 [Hyphomicrobiaceae bacterium]
MLFRAGELGLERFGYNFENCRLLTTLAQRVEQQHNILWMKELATGTELTAELRITHCADGTTIAAP